MCIEIHVLQYMQVYTIDFYIGIRCGVFHNIIRVYILLTFISIIIFKFLSMNNMSD